MSVSQWSTTASDNNAAPPTGAPEGIAPSSINNILRQVMSSVRQMAEDLPWFDFGHAPTRVDDSSFTVPTDLTETYTVGRRVRLIGSTTVYGTISTSQYLMPATTVTVVLDSGIVPSSLESIALSNDDGRINTPSYAVTPAETAVSITPVEDRSLPGDAVRYGADPTGVTDSTVALQRWIDATWAMYNYVDTQGVWGGGGGAAPVLTLPPGKFKVTNTLYLPNGITLRGTGRPANTINHTRIIMDSTTTSAPNGAGDNRNKPMFKFRRGSTPSGGVLVNQYFLSTIQDVEFAYVTPGSTFGSPYSGTGIPFGDYPAGGTFVIDIDTVDLRFVGCCFQHTPAAIRIKNVPASSIVQGDGFSGQTGVYGLACCRSSCE